VSARAVTHILMPLTTHFIMESTPAALRGGDQRLSTDSHGGKAGELHSLLEEAVKTLGSLVSHPELPWSQYYSTLQFFLKQIGRPAHGAAQGLERVLIRVVCAILDHFHYFHSKQGEPVSMNGSSTESAPGLPHSGGTQVSSQSEVQQPADDVIDAEQVEQAPVTASAVAIRRCLLRSIIPQLHQLLTETTAASGSAASAAKRAAHTSLSKKTAELGMQVSLKTSVVS